MAAMAATSSLALKQAVSLKTDFSGKAVRQASAPASVRFAAPVAVRAGGYEEELRKTAVSGYPGPE